MGKEKIQAHPIVENKIYWSPSRHRAARNCLKQYHYRYSFFTPQEVDESLYLYGSLIHEYLETDKKPDVDMLLEQDNGLELLSYMDMHYERIKEYAQRLKFMMKDQKETPFLLPVKFPSGRKPKYNIFIYGVIDRRLFDNGNLIDFKTSSNKLSESKLKSSKQFTFYLWAEWCRTEELKKLFVLNMKKGNLSRLIKPEVYLTKIEKTLDDFEGLMYEVEDLWEKCVENQDMSANVKNCFFCPFKTLCNEYQETGSKTN
jgi:hypothetical protein